MVQCSSIFISYPHKIQPFQWLHHQEARGFLTPTAGAVAMLRQPEQQSGGVLGTLQSVKDTYEKDLKERLFWMVSGIWCRIMCWRIVIFLAVGKKHVKQRTIMFGLRGTGFLPPKELLMELLMLLICGWTHISHLDSFGPFLYMFLVAGGCWIFIAIPIFSPGAARSWGVTEAEPRHLATAAAVRTGGSWWEREGSTTGFFRPPLWKDTHTHTHIM